MRVGLGYDVHRFIKGGSLVLGGVEIPYDKGLEGWSDADVLTHAVIDALLGAAALGDIGRHFPADAPEYKDISSLILLEKTREMLAEQGWRIVNIDATVLAAAPRLMEFLGFMRRELGRALDIDVNRVSVKAGTGNGLGEIGRGEGIAAYAVALLEGSQDENI
ncbi:unnamed protein product [marine sediment metagenome]|uniref:2-C-methyl-D-erythritol 2,4-cyclodiphosphate synthase n=1 Tax=marine sediment metagenome TaxID=412755 RepID=X0X6I8_9ZZZZ